MTDHDAAAREILVREWAQQYRMTQSGAERRADETIESLSAAGYQIARTPEVGMVTISAEDARELFRALPILSTRRQEVARYALYEAIERAEGKTGGYCARRYDMSGEKT